MLSLNYNWGPSFWDMMHSAAIGAPETMTVQDQKHYQTFFESLAHVLPCSSCRQEYKKLLQENPIDVQSKNNLVIWTWKIHNLVNLQLKKPRFTFLQMKERYCGVRPSQRKYCATCSFNGTIR